MLTQLRKRVTAWLLCWLKSLTISHVVTVWSNFQHFLNWNKNSPKEFTRSILKINKSSSKSSNYWSFSPSSTHLFWVIRSFAVTSWVQTKKIINMRPLIHCKYMPEPSKFMTSFAYIAVTNMEIFFCLLLIQMHFLCRDDEEMWMVTYQKIFFNVDVSYFYARLHNSTNKCYDVIWWW